MPASGRYDHVSTDLSRLIRTSLTGTFAMSLLAFVAVGQGYAPDAGIVATLLGASLLAAALTSVSYVGIARPLLRSLVDERTERHRTESALSTARRMAEFAEHLDTAIEVAESEDEVLVVLGRAMGTLLADRDNYVLLSPPNEPRVTWSVEASDDGLADPVPMGTAMRCSALSLGRPVAVTSSTELDACPHLAVHDWEVSSICVPIRVGDSRLGVAHSAGPAGDLPAPDVRSALETVARRVGLRIAALRAERDRVDHVSIDPLTGLPSHTLVRQRLREVIAEPGPFSVAFCDLDRFADYNEAHGHDQGDRALRIYSEVMGATLRPTDVISRYAGDRFLVLFPHCSSAHAAAAMERVREELTLRLAMHELDPFTCSVGVNDSSAIDTVEELLEGADLALSIAKHGGGNRVATAEFESAPFGDLDIDLD